MKLIETAGRTVSEMPYICLSHCWGPNLDQVAVTTKTTNLTERLHQVRAEELSRTFVEAIEIAPNLQKLYIWIDALRICQDSLEDWRAVSANMASIYINAVFTLAASASKNSSKAFSVHAVLPLLCASFWPGTTCQIARSSSPRP
jgi:hypothetical protein